MDNRLKEAIRVGKDFLLKRQGVNKSADNTILLLERVKVPEALQTLIDYAEQRLKVQGMMPQKKEIPIERGVSYYCEIKEAKAYNQAISDCTYAIIQKLDGIRNILWHYQGGEELHIATKKGFDKLALSIKEYLLGKENV